MLDIGVPPGQKVRPVDLMAIEFRAIDAGKFGLAVDDYAAYAAHASSIDHYRVQSDNRLYGKWFGRLGNQTGQVGTTLTIDHVDFILACVIINKIIDMPFEAF